MSIFYVATLAQYVLVEAANEQEARKRGLVELRNQYAEQGLRLPTEARTVRLATHDEIEFHRWHTERVAAESQN
jgi:hypothetical protein